MTYRVTPARGAGPQRCRYISEQHLQLFIEYVGSHPDCGLDVQELTRQALSFQEQQQLLAPVYRRSYDDCERARKQREFDDKRSDHLGRLVVRLIADVFVENGGRPPEEGGLSIRIVPGLLTVLQLALGTDVLQEARDKGEVIVKRLREKHGDEFEWEDYFDDTDAQGLLAKVLVELAVSFVDYDRRLAWAVDVLNTALEHETKVDNSVPHWVFETVHFRTLSLALFRPIIEVTATAEGRIAFSSAYGEDKMIAARTFFERARLV
ncbi:MAG: hypothetical protein HOC33_16100 [Alphaproteobacteria bacterium]|nr:hypothetical protein [Alphaproteobacteria bacterium]MBT4083573.1 hypothetical protein [Alphaproteobacteria bacterium]MBT4545377.1 hypothetical protein [Alphaproteobacteria bacterium]